MSYLTGMTLAIVFTGIVLGALFLPDRENREIVWSIAAVLGFWTLVIAITA